MAKNYVTDGKSITLVAGVGGVKSGVPVINGKLIVVPVADAAEGEQYGGLTGGEWHLPCATGLEAGAEVKWDANAGKLNTGAASATNVLFGKLTSDEADGTARCLLLN